MPKPESISRKATETSLQRVLNPQLIGPVGYDSTRNVLPLQPGMGVRMIRAATPTLARNTPAAENPSSSASMTQSAAIVLVLLVLGNVIAEHFSLPVPGAALGLVALAFGFMISGGPDPGSEALFDFAAPYFPLFFVPAAVGVVASIDIISVAWVHILTAIILGTSLTLLITGLVFQALLQRIASRAQT